MSMVVGRSGLALLAIGAAAVAALSSAASTAAQTPLAGDPPSMRVVAEDADAVAARLARAALDARANDARLVELSAGGQLPAERSTAAVWESEFATRRAVQVALVALVAVEQATLEAWRQRAELRDMPGIGQHREAEAQIRLALGQLAARSATGVGELATAREAARDQRQALDALDRDAPGHAAERALMQARAEHVDVLERTQQALDGLKSAFEQSRGDLRQRSRMPSAGERLRGVVDEITALLRRTWAAAQRQM